MIRQRDIILIPFPFSDQSGRKVRPVIVISNDIFNERSEDVLVVGLTSSSSRETYSVPVTNKDLEEGKLMTDCTAKTDNILKIDKELAIKKIGRVDKETLLKIKGKIVQIID